MYQGCPESECGEDQTDVTNGSFQMNPPTVLYKYLSPARIDVLLNKHLRFTQACALNDPFEFSPGAPVSDAEGLGHFEARLAKSRETQCLENSRTFGVLSLAQENNSIPMWTHYAATHSGFAIGFDAESGWLGQAIREQKLDRVRYIRERICSTRLSPDHPELELDDIFMTKSAEWVSGVNYFYRSTTIKIAAQRQLPFHLDLRRLFLSQPAV